MKKLILFFAAFALAPRAGAQVPRMALYEEFTGENCGACALTNPGFWALCDTNTAKLIHITYMAAIPISGAFYAETNIIGDTMQSYYDVPFAPYGRLDGQVADSSCSYPGDPGCATQSDIDTEQAITSPIGIVAKHYFNATNDSVYGQVAITASVAFAASQLKLRAAFTRSMHFSVGPGDNGELDFENVVRTMFPDTFGQAIETYWAPGDSHIYSYSGKITGMEAITDYTQSDSGVVVWVQNDSAGTPGLVGTFPAARNYQSVLQAVRSANTAEQAVDTTNSPSVVQAINPKLRMNIYPNPANESATLSIYMEQGSDVQIKVTDELGRSVYVISQSLIEGAQEIELPTGTLPQDVYTVQLLMNSKTIVQKLVVAR